MEKNKCGILESCCAAGTTPQWRPAFAAAMDLELSANRNSLTYQKEYKLKAEPLETDLLVIQKETDIQIDNDIGKLFRGHNIIEYKFPRYPLDIDTFYKAQAYATLYKVYGRRPDECPADEITLSLVREAKPVKLFHYFKKHKVPVARPYPGIYYVQAEVLFPTQIVVTGELDPEGHTWLKALSENMNRQSMEAFLEKIQTLRGKIDRELAHVVLAVSTNANQEIVEELQRDHKMQALLSLTEPAI